MKKQELLSKIDEMEKQLAELKNQVNSIEFEGIKKGIRQIPQAGDSYWYVAEDGIILQTIWRDRSSDFFRFSTGNCFKTKQKAKRFKENILTKQALKDLALELNKGVAIDWDNYNLTKYCIFISCVDELYLHSINSNKHLGQIYCYDKDFLTIAKDRIGEEKLIKLIKSGI